MAVYMKDVKPLERLRRRPIYVRYMAMRKCRHNPSWEAFLDLPEADRRALWDKWEDRHPDKRHAVAEWKETTYVAHRQNTD